MPELSKPMKCNTKAKKKPVRDILPETLSQRHQAKAKVKASQAKEKPGDEKVKPNTCQNKRLAEAIKTEIQKRQRQVENNTKPEPSQRKPNTSQKQHPGKKIANDKENQSRASYQAKQKNDVPCQSQRLATAAKVKHKPSNDRDATHAK